MDATEYQADATQPPVLLRGEGLVRAYDGSTVVDVESIEVRAGEVQAFLGPNGAGKSTLMRLLAGLESPDAGRLLYKGREVRQNDRQLRAAVAAVLQRPLLWRGTVGWNVAFALKARRLPAAERELRVRQTLKTLEIDHLEQAPVDTLSGGEAQRVSLARALAVEPELLFLDEPTADLDVTVRRRLLADMERIVRDAASAIVLITHDPTEAFSLADRVAVIERGRIAQTGTPADIFESPATEFVASVTGAEFSLIGRVEEIGEGTLIVRLDSGHEVEAVGSADERTRVRIGYRPEDVVIGPPQSSATSARNRFQVQVSRLNPQGGLVRVRLDAEGLSIEAVITRNALQDLGLEVGSSVVAQIKATALHVFPA